MHSISAGYGRAVMTESWREQELADDGSTWNDVASVVERQHAELSEELRQLAGWLELSDITVEPRGDLAPMLRP